MPAKLIQFTPATIARAAEVVKGGGLLVYPTDTVYGLGCDPFNDSAVRSLFEAKGRSARPIPVLCDSLRSARGLGSLTGTALDLAKKFWPGALTIVVPLRRHVPQPVDQGSGEVGLRVPDSDLTVRLIHLCGGHLAGTSANVSGHPSCRSASDASEALGDRVDLILDGGELKGTESTVVRASGSSVAVFREGSVVLSGSLPSARRRI